MRNIRVLLVLALLFAVLGGTRATQAVASQTAVVDPRLREALVGNLAPVEVVVTFRDGGAPGAEALNVLQQAGITTGFTFRTLPMAGVLATAAQVDALAARPEIRSLYLNRQLAYDNAEATELTGVDKVRRDAAMTKLNGGLPVSGKGVAVLVNDSGVDGTHADHQFGSHLVQNVEGATNLNSLDRQLLPVTYVEDVPNTDVTGGHGTHVAGIVGATGARSNGKYEGVAPGASLVGYGSGAGLFILDTLGGFDYALTHQFEYNIRVITNSWGNTGDVNTDVDPEDPTTRATKLAYDRGIVVVFSAGNSGPGEGTITGNFKKAPWVIAVAAGDKQGRLADFSSRGVPGKQKSFVVDGESWTWEDRPTVTAPGVAIVSTRTASPTGALGTDVDATTIEPAYLPFYTTLDGTSMAAPHVAGIVALMLDANPLLSPMEVKQILQETATNIPGGEPWEVGAGYVNAYAAVDRAFQARSYGATVNLLRNFNSNVNTAATRTPFSVDYNPALLASNRYSFTVPSGVTELVARVNARGVLGETGNTLNLVLIAPDGTETGSGVSVLFPLYTDRTVSVSAPTPGTWTVELRGLRGAAENPVGGALPERVNGELTLKKAGSISGLNDIAGHPAEAAIKSAVGERLADGLGDGKFRPDSKLLRKELAQYLVMGNEVRQFLPANGASFGDVSSADRPFVEAVAAKGGAMRDQTQVARGVMLPAGAGKFAPNQAVVRAELAYSLVQSLGLEQAALERNGQPVTVQYGDQRVAVTDAAQIPAGLEGYVQLALDLNILNAFFSVQQGPFDLEPTITASFKPTQQVTRGEFAVAATRFFSAYLMP